eukprot:m.181783 g.181783  ORF g.181783 m.181783 type:complete len:400 (+) comp15359_c0_seq1:265-1464(+)
MAIGSAAWKVITDVWIVALMVILGVGDTVLVALLFWTYNRSNPPGCSTDVNATLPCHYDSATSEIYPVFLNQATGTVYGIITFPLLALWSWREWGSTHRDKKNGILRKSPPNWKLVLIGCMNGLGNFCAGVGQVHTGGTSQALLQLVGVPFVLLLSWIFLGQKPSLVATLSALAIVGGTALSAIPHASKDTGSLWYSNLLFFSAQVFFSGEKVYEEATFGQYSVDVLWMFLWTLWTQVALGWVTWPVQSVPDFGGINISDIPSITVDGVLCTGAVSTHGRPYCDWQNPVLFWTYCAVDYSYYAIGLYIIQERGANLMILAAAISLPLSQLMFCIRAVGGPNTSQFLWTDAVALAIVLVGFGAYYLYSPEGRKQRLGAHVVGKVPPLAGETQPLLLNDDE